MSPSNGSTCFIAGRCIESLFRHFRSHHLSGIKEDLIRFTTSLVIRIRVSVRITVIVGL